jgi:16S rRNA (cytosine967-C5)-methyltransferase
METEDTKYSCDGVRVISPEKPKIRGTDAYDQGYYEVQDEGSQLICLSFETFPGMKIVDLCCGRGGKALHLASLLQSGNLVCHDIDLKKLNEAKLRISRPGICSSDLNINFICSESKNVLGGRGGDISMHSADEIDESDINVSGIIDLLNGHADVVLVDAPCSSLGTLRRGPNVRWEADIDQLLDLYPRMQKQILSQAVSLVKPGGSLIYATCTFSREECKDICEWFQNSYCVGDNAKFKPVPLRNWSTLFNLNFAEFHEKNVIQLSSHGNGTDTFFIARFDCLNN